MRPLRTLLPCLLALVAFTLLAGCGGEKTETTTEQGATSGPLAAFDGLSGSLDIAGGTAHIPVMNAAAQAIMAHNPQIRITVAGGGSGVGVQKVGEGLVQIGNTGRPLSTEEKAQYGLQSWPFAIDGVCAVVHPDNPVAALSGDQLRDLFAGKITSWRDVGGPDTPVHLFTRDEASGTRKVFWKIALQKGEIAAGANVVASNGAMKTAVSGDPAALGYVSLGHLDDQLKAPDLDGVAVTQENAAGGVYPVVRRLYMNTKGEPTPLCRAFIAYVTGPAGREIVRQSGYLPLPE
jgi:phosphate transport system substrate-binding protein